MGSEGVRKRVRCAETMPTLYGTRTFGIRAAPGISREGTLGTAKEVHASRVLEMLGLLSFKLVSKISNICFTRGMCLFPKTIKVCLPPERFELSTPGLQDQCSATEL